MLDESPLLPPRKDYFYKRQQSDLFGKNLYSIEEFKDEKQDKKSRDVSSASIQTGVRILC